MVSITQPNGEAMSKPALQLGLSNDQVIEKAAIDLPQLPDRSVRKISERAIALCKANLPRFGQPGAILVSGDMIVIHGEEILLAARELGWTHINIVRMPDLNGNERRVLTLALAKLPLLSSWDDEALRIEFSELSAHDLDFEVEDLTGFTIGEIDVLLHPKEDTAKDDPADARVARVSAGPVISGFWESTV